MASPARRRRRDKKRRAPRRIQPRASASRSPRRKAGDDSAVSNLASAEHRSHEEPCLARSRPSRLDGEGVVAGAVECRIGRWRKRRSRREGRAIGPLFVQATGSDRSIIPNARTFYCPSSHLLFRRPASKLEPSKSRIRRKYRENACTTSTQAFVG
jgi:hypothetical protein